MKLVVPYIGTLQPLENRVMRLAEFLGIHCEAVPLQEHTEQYAAYLRSLIPDRRSCFVVNPEVIRQWVGTETLPTDLVSCFTSYFSHVLVHGVRPDAFHTATVAALSSNQLSSIRGVDAANSSYKIAQRSTDICGAFAGLSFGPANPANDLIFSAGGGSPAFQSLISIGGQPFMAALRHKGGAELVFLASRDVADLRTEVSDDVPMVKYFSQLVPHAMALRHAFGSACWRPGKPHASLIIDDPLLRPNYGFLNFESLLHLMRQHNFQTTIAFIPHNFRRSSPHTAKMFRENSARFALCFHGNDHTSAELASTDVTLLNTMLGIAEHRMHLHREATGIQCDRVMVFPQGKFSVDAMKVLRSRNFYAAVNTTPHPMQQTFHLTIGELSQPAVLRYSDFPLFLRTPAERTQNPEIAFNLFFGRPVLIVEHHDIFQHPERLAELAARVNSVAPDISWSNLTATVADSVLRRRVSDGAYQIRAYSGVVRVSNESSSAALFSIQWSHSGLTPQLEQVLEDGLPRSDFEVADDGIQVIAELAPHSSHTFSVIYRNEYGSLRGLGFRWKAQAFLRRRLSEMRDNHLSKNPHVLAGARRVQRQLLRRL